MGDEAFMKMKWQYDWRAQITGTNPNIFWTGSWNDLSFPSFSFFNATQALVSNANGFVDTPPGFTTWAQFYGDYRVNACKITLEVFNEGQTSSATGIGTIGSPTCYIGTAFESASALTGGVNPQAASLYWSPASLANARWSKQKIMTDVGSTGARAKISNYITGRALDEDFVEQEFNSRGQITGSNLSPPVPTFGTCTNKYIAGCVIGTLGGSAVTAGSFHNFTVRQTIQLYYKMWTKQPNNNIP